MLEDVRYAFRLLTKNPGFAAVALFALALGSGATTAIFSIVNAVVLRPLAFPESERVVRVVETNRRLRGPGGFSQDNFRAWREANDVFEQMAAYNPQAMTLTGVEEPVQLSGTSVSPELFALLRIPTALGRTLESSDGTPGNERVLVLSHVAWRKHFGADPGIVGRVLTLDGLSYTVVGVMPARFEFPDKTSELWTPLLLGAAAAPTPGVRAVRLMPVIARLKDGVSIKQAEASGRAVVKRLREQDPVPDAFQTELQLVSLHDQLVAPVRPALLVLLAAVAFVLLIACANVANLLLARASERQREVAVRAALGAERARLVRQTLTESLVLSLTGALLGLVLAFVAVRLLPQVAPKSLPRLDEIAIDWSVLAFTLLVSLLTGILFGLAPAFASFRVNLIGSLKESGARADMPSRLLRHGRVRSLLVMAEIALALVLLVGAGLLIKSFVARMRVDRGYEAQNALTLAIQLPNYRYAGAKSRTSFYGTLLDRVGAMPGVVAAGVTNLLPLAQSNIIMSFRIEGRPEPHALEQMPQANFRIVSPGFFRAMGARLVRGRDFTTSDTESSPPVIIANEALAQKYFPDEDPLGKKLQFGEIVGIVRNIKQEGVESESRPELYVSYTQARLDMSMMLGRMNLVVRTPGDPMDLVPALNGEISSIDPELPRFTATTMEERVAESVAQPRFYALVLTLFASVALALATIGIYGVVSYSVQQRTRETGVRMALGADRRDIAGMVVRQGLVLVLVGLTVGVAAALALTRLLKGFLFNVSTADPSTFVGIALILAAAALLACYVPARRAAAQDPVAALRCE